MTTLRPGESPVRITVAGTVEVRDPAVQETEGRWGYSFRQTTAVVVEDDPGMRPDAAVTLARIVRTLRKRQDQKAA
jgi:hypothetical protein